MRHLNNMMNALCDEPSPHEWHLVINDEYDTSSLNSEIRIHRYPVRYSSGIRRIRFDNLIVPELLRRWNIDLLISFSNIGPFRPSCKHILFEMNALYFCDHIHSLYRAKERFDFAIKRFLIDRCAKNAHCVVTPSESLKRKICEVLSLEEGKFRVIHHAMDRNFVRNVEKTELFDPDRVSFLYPSHLAKHKGVHILLGALEIVQQADPELFDRFEIVCTFAREDDPTLYDAILEAVEKNGWENTLRIVGHQPQERINDLYAEADYMIYTSTCESFGFSMLEAKVFKLPALCSDIPVNREISKNSARYYRWNDPNDLAEKLVRFVRERPADFDFEDELLNWHWEDYAKVLIETIEEVSYGRS